MIRKVVFMGTPDFAVGTLQALIASPDYQVQAVFTQPDRARGRGKTLQMTPVKETAAAAGIPVCQPQRIRDARWLEVLEELRPDVIVVVAYGQLIPQSILQLPPYGCINVHASLLPKYRGAAPIQWAVLSGEKESGVTTMRMDAGLDTGDMIMREAVPLAPDETGGSLFEKLSRTGASLLLRTLEAVGNGTARYEPQPQESPTAYASMLTKKDGEIDWTKSAAEIERMIRGLNPWPSAYTVYRGRTLKLWAARALPAETEARELQEHENSGGAGDRTDTISESAQQPGDFGDTGDRTDTISESAQQPDNSGDAGESTGPKEEAAKAPDGCLPGTVAEVTESTLKIRTGDGLLSILELQPEGRKRMPVDAFLRGYPVKPGEKLMNQDREKRMD